MKYSKETMDKARDMLCEMVELTNNKSFGQSRSGFVMGMWNAFDKGREYEQFVITAEAKEEALKFVLKTITHDDALRCVKAITNG